MRSGCGSNQQSPREKETVSLYNREKTHCPNQSRMELELNRGFLICKCSHVYIRGSSLRLISRPYLKRSNGRNPTVCCSTCVRWFRGENPRKKKFSSSFRRHLFFVVFFRRENGKANWKTKCWWWKPTERFSWYFSFLFFFSFSLLLLRVWWESAAHLAREPVIDQPDYFPAPIIITGCNRTDPLSIAPSLPSLFSLLFLWGGNYFSFFVSFHFLVAVNAFVFSLFWQNSAGDRLVWSRVVPNWTQPGTVFIGNQVGWSRCWRLRSRGRPCFAATRETKSKNSSPSNCRPTF